MLRGSESSICWIQGVRGFVPRDLGTTVGLSGFPRHHFGLPHSNPMGVLQVAGSGYFRPASPLTTSHLQLPAIKVTHRRHRRSSVAIPGSSRGRIQGDDAGKPEPTALSWRTHVTHHPHRLLGGIMADCGPFLAAPLSARVLPFSPSLGPGPAAEPSTSSRRLEHHVG